MATALVSPNCSFQLILFLSVENSGMTSLELQQLQFSNRFQHTSEFSLSTKLYTKIAVSY